MNSVDKIEKIQTAHVDANGDAIHGSGDSHVVGTTIGAIGGAAVGGAITGAMVGTVAGPLGTIAGAAGGAVVGALAGGVAGHEIGKGVDPAMEHEYWRDNYLTRPYALSGMPYGMYGPAYQYGWEARVYHHDQSFDQVAPHLQRQWSAHRGTSTLDWEQAKHAVRDSWNRISGKNPPASKTKE